MTCERWADQRWMEKLAAYFDGELPADEAGELQKHLRGCGGCAAESLRIVQEKLAVRDAGQRFMPDPAFRARMQGSIVSGGQSATLSSSAMQRWRGWLPVFGIATIAVAALMGAALVLTVHRGRDSRQLTSELVDQHVATLASANPVDVVSTDRHTVKPWFEGKIPFTFNLPELQGSPFLLVGGRVCYLSQSPGAELIFRVRQHQISVFIFSERGLGEWSSAEAAWTSLSFEVRTWRHNGLLYFAIGDVNAQDLEKLSDLIKAAG